ncbi:hypothetical protein SAY87_005313 [Trapa incisa]|uniref:Uncharacterized protein n=1 Tax=Trapa incisa TaxID=236973 RepID=A0AAN7KC76_9MYRT|nr:hypothetical protein SAY87_005313 [Trapa incisa]
MVLTVETSEVTAPSPDCSKFCEVQGIESPCSQVSLENVVRTEVKVNEVMKNISNSQIMSKDQQSVTEILEQELSCEDTRNEDKGMPFEELSMEAMGTGHALTAADEGSTNGNHAEECNKCTIGDLEEISASSSKESNYTIPSTDTGQMDGTDNGSQEKKVPIQNVLGVNNNQAGSFRDQHDHGEKSFGMAGPISGLITYSGPIAYSGSISRRSDSSTTSTQSFAFPILPQLTGGVFGNIEDGGRDFSVVDSEILYGIYFTTKRVKPNSMT